LYWYIPLLQEVIIPMVMDARMPEDVLFLLFEEDFRFWPHGEDPDSADDYKARLGEVLQKRKRSRSRNKMNKKPLQEDPAPQTGAPSSSSSGAYRPGAKGKEKGKNIITEYHYTPLRGSTDVEDLNDGLSSNVADLLRMATKCHRENMGDLIWFGWCSHSNGTAPSWLSKGSTGLMLTKKGAACVSTAMEEGKVPRGHIDLELLKWLRLPGEAKTAKACYIYPSVGSFFQHPSGCDPKNFGEEQGGRPSGWNIKCASKGTRTIHDEKGQRSKWVIQWNAEEGRPRERQWLPFPPDSELHTAEFRWKSYREDEPTASSKSGGKAKPEKEKLTDRAHRLKNQWNAREKLRFLCGSVLQAAPPAAFFFALPIPSHHHMPLHRISHHASLTPFLISPLQSRPHLFFSTPQHASLTQSSPPTRASVDRQDDGSANRLVDRCVGEWVFRGGESFRSQSWHMVEW